MKRIILLTFTVTITYLAISGYGSYPSIGGLNVASDGCNAGTGCHGPSSSAIELSFSLVLKSTKDTIKNGKYTPGAMHYIYLTGADPTAKAYGFMLKSSHSGGTVHAGTFGSAYPTKNTYIRFMSGFYIVEQKWQIPAEDGSFTTWIEWTAPPTGTGDVTMEFAVCSSDSSLTPTGDHWKKSKVTLKEGLAATVDYVVQNIPVNIYPNPVTDVLNVRMKGNHANPYVYHVLNMNGAVVQEGTLQRIEESINISRLPHGTYILKLSDDNETGHARFTK